MPKIDPDVARARAQLAARVRHHSPQDEQDEAARDLAVARIADHIRRVVEAAPPLTAEQSDRIAALLPRPPRSTHDPDTGAA